MMKRFCIGMWVLILIVNNRIGKYNIIKIQPRKFYDMTLYKNELLCTQ